MTSLTDIANKIIDRKGNEKLANMMTKAEVEAAIEAAVLAEREACAKVCEELHLIWYVKSVNEQCAEAIRARGEK